MRTPREIYTAYKIMPNLQLHQLRVAAVGKLICDNFTHPLKKGDVILAGLFHDMGNILKFDFIHFPQFTEPEGLTYWESVKEEYRAKYGSDEHEASIKIGKEIRLPQSVLWIIDTMRFSRSEEILSSDNYELKVAKYGDLRAGPHGILPLQERLEEAKRRYGKKKASFARDTDVDRLNKACFGIERQLFQDLSITPEDIHDASVAPIVEELWEYPVTVSVSL